MEISSDILHGFTDVLLLAQLARGDSYGYAVAREISLASGGACELKEGTLYSSFRRMEEAGLIRSYWGDETRGGRRRYFAITAAGVERLQEEIGRWENTKQVLDLLLNQNVKTDGKMPGNGEGTPGAKETEEEIRYE